MKKNKQGEALSMCTFICTFSGSFSFTAMNSTGLIVMTSWQQGKRNKQEQNTFFFGAISVTYCFQTLNEVKHRAGKEMQGSTV